MRISDLTKGKKKYVALALLFVGWLLSFLDRMVMNIAVIPIKEEFNLDPSMVGIILSSFFISYACMQIPGGWLADKIGSRKLVIFAIAFWSLFTIFSGLAWSLASLVIIRILFGIGEGFYPSASQKGISEFFPKNERSKASSTMMSSNFFGAALGPLIAAPLIVWLGWRHMFVAIGVVGFLLVAAFWFFYRPAAQTEKIEVKKKETNKVPLKNLLNNSGIWKIVVMWFAAGIINWGFSSWMPIYLVETRNLDILSVGLIASVPALLGGFATILSGILLNKYFINTEKYYAAGGMLLTTVFLYLMIISDSMVAVVIYWNLVFIFKSFVFSVAFSLPHQLLPKEAIGTGMGMVNTGAQAAGFIAPIVMGFIISATGSYDTAFFFLVACGILSTIAALSITKKDRKVSPQNAEIAME
ncbi:MFS transporter [Sporosarcina soli]|uniref:MFS transporter n=1 Tax=Sporosarcina soli TaxID=334736 RepID=A0ABW0TD40_9BACL